jgi:hypothetical protein
VEKGLLTIIGQLNNPIRHHIQMAMSDAVVSFSAKSVGIFSNLPRVSIAGLGSAPVKNNLMNIASVYAAYAFCKVHVKASLPDLDALMAELDLLPQSYAVFPAGATNVQKAIANGNAAGNTVAEFWSRAGKYLNFCGIYFIYSLLCSLGVNPTGSATSKYNLKPYFYPGYEPVNDAYTFQEHSRFQPLLVFDDNGFAFQQTFDGAILANSTSLILNMTKYVANPPAVYGVENSKVWAIMKPQVDDVLKKSANLNDFEKMNSEYFNNLDKYFLSTNLKIAQQKGYLCDVSKWSSIQAVVHAAHYEAFQVAFKNKAHYDFVRPHSLIAEYYKDTPLTAYGGKGKGTVDDIKGSEWRAYMYPVPAEPEYVSGRTCKCSALASAYTALFETDTTDVSTTYAVGSSAFEAGTPSAPVTLSFSSWKTFSNRCGESRVYGGYHFTATAQETVRVCSKIGADVLAFMKKREAGQFVAPY